MQPAEAGHLFGVQEVPGSNPGGPTKFLKDLQILTSLRLPPGVRLVAFWSPILDAKPRSFACPSLPGWVVMMAM